MDVWTPNGFDVFLSHNGHDKPFVEEIGAQLRGKGLRVWLDKWALRPGFPWQEGLEEGVRSSRAVAVFVGRGGLGSWQDPEMRAFLARSKREEVPVIPVLIPGCPDTPQLTLFLEALTWVDLRGGVTEDGLARLIWGITGIKAADSDGVTAVATGKDRCSGDSGGSKAPRGWIWKGLTLALFAGLALAVGAWLWPRSPESSAVRVLSPTWLRGQVVDESDRTLQGVRISRRDGAPGDAVTDAQGRFALEVSEPPGARVRLRAEHAGSQPGDEFCLAGSDGCWFELLSRHDRPARPRTSP